MVAGQATIDLADIQQYRSFFGLPANAILTTLVGSRPPGSGQGDLSEADLDLELAGAVARNATIHYVYSYDVLDAVQYAIDKNLAPVISVSYGVCELQSSQADATTFESWAKQAGAQGITWFAASGDDGAADCIGGTDPGTNGSLSVDLPAAVPQVTGVGGTEFNEGGGNYWNATNGASHASALSYIPEIAWNDTAFDGVPAATGGGASIYFSKPSWQAGTGVPDDGVRDVPDISLSGSADHDGYPIFTGGSFHVYGGTSVGPPQFAGIAALLNQYLIANGFQASPGLGNINPVLYSLAKVTGVFHDTIGGDNILSPCPHIQRCTLAAIGYHTGAGYDLATGLGSVNVYNMAIAWHNSGVVSKAAVSLSLSAAPSSLVFSGTTILKAAVTSTNGGTATGTVAFSVGNFSLGTATLSGANGTAVATLTLAGIQLAAGANVVTATYYGDTAYNGATASTNVTVTSPTNGLPSITSLLNGASFTQALAPGGILSVFGSNLAPAMGNALSTPLQTWLAGTTVTIDGIAAPLYYVSPTQLNVQIPYEVPANSTAVLGIDNNGSIASASFHVSGAAPAIFTFANGAPVPFTSAPRGQVINLYITGAGLVSPPVATGATPPAGTPVADLPAPVGAAKVTVGGVAATIDFIGIPTWSVGVVQVNYTIPVNAPLGPQAVILSIDGVQSAAATLTVAQ